MKQDEILQTVDGMINGTRKGSHGDSFTQHTHAARLWSAWFGFPVSASDVCECMSLLKKSRKHQGDYNDDDYLDDVGYTALASDARGKEEALKKRGDSDLVNPSFIIAEGNVQPGGWQVTSLSEAERTK